MIVWGYIISILYITALLIVTKLLRGKTENVELGRKVVHIGTFLILIIADVFFARKEHLVILSLLFTVLTVISNKFKLFKGIERSGNGQFGTVYYSLALLILSSVCVLENAIRGNCESTYACLAVAFAALALGDGTASLIGSRIKSCNIHKEKTILGTAACCLFTALGILLLKLLHIVEIGYPAVAAIGLMAGIAELAGDKWDNLIVAFSAYFLCLLLTLLGTEFLIATLIFEGVFYVAFLLKFITLFGAIAAGFIGAAFYYFGGLFPFLFLIFCYAAMLVVSLVQKAKKCDLSSVVAKTKGKDLTEIFVNGFFATIAIFLYGFSGARRFLTLSLIVISANFVDSFSSDIGAFSKKQPYDILKGKPVEKGMSGGVTLLGTLAALIGATVFSLLNVLITGLSPVYLFLVLPLTFSGTITDSVLGSLLQAKFQCSICGKYTEKTTHCGAPTTHVGGVKQINNDVVNFMASGITFLLSFILFLL